MRTLSMTSLKPTALLMTLIVKIVVMISRKLSMAPTLILKISVTKF